MSVRGKLAVPLSWTVTAAGDSPSFRICVRGKERDCAKRGIHTVIHHFRADGLLLADEPDQEEVMDGILGRERISLPCFPALPASWHGR